MISPSLERHITARTVDLGQSIVHRKKIYLDLNFWIKIRDAALGTNTDSNIHEFLNLLRKGVACGNLICPLSKSIFIEMTKQAPNQKGRIATAKLIDELSLGISFIPNRDLVGKEIQRWLFEIQGHRNLHDMQDLIWVKAGYTLGYYFPELSEFEIDQTDEDDLQKKCFDGIWYITTTDMVNSTLSMKFGRDYIDQTIEEINRRNAEHSHELISFEKSYDIELRGMIECYGPVAAQIIKQISSPLDGWPLSDSPEDKEYREIGAKNLMYEEIKMHHRNDRLRSIHIYSSIHAAMRWDKTRQFKTNDYYDFEHAQVALGYCDAFFTERPLKHLVTRPPLCLTEMNGCVVIAISDVTAAVEYLKSLS